VGLVPLEAMLSAGLKYHNNPDDADDIDLVNAAVSGLMLDKFGAFDSRSNIIEWAIKGAHE
jgi:hypothetical protein